MIAYIEDGYTERGYIAEVEGLHPALAVTYRPALPSEVNAFYRSIEGVKPEEVEAKAAEWIATRLSSWDVKDGGNRPVTCGAYYAQRLRPKLFFKLLKCLRGEEAWDQNPATSKEAVERELKEVEEAKKANLSIGEWRARRDAKNSPTA